MKIAITAFSTVTGGALNYLENAIPAIAELSQENQYTVFVSAGQKIGFKQKNIEVKKIPLPYGSTFFRLLFEQLILPAWLKIYNFDLLFCLSDYRPFFLPCKSAILVRSLNMFSEFYSKKGIKQGARMKAVRFLANHSALKADRVIFPSKFAMNYSAKRLGLPREKTVVVYHGKSCQMEGFNDKKSPEKERPFALFVSNQYSYKNLDSLLEALSLLEKGKTKALRLLVAGEFFEKGLREKTVSKIEKLGLCNKISLLGLVDRKTLFGLYKNADCMAFCSLVESFGHPLVEAMHFGTPIACSDFPTMREIAGDAAIYFDPLKPQDIAEKIEKIVADRKLAESLSEKGRERAKNFSWEKTARETIEVLKQAANKK